MVAVARLLLLTPPEFFYLPASLAGNDPARSATLRAVQQALRSDPSVEHHVCRGRSFETAEAAVATGSDAIAILGGPFDRTACETLAEALRRLGHEPTAVATPSVADTPAVLHDQVGLTIAAATTTEATPELGEVPWPQADVAPTGTSSWIQRYRLTTPGAHDELRRVTARTQPWLQAHVETVLEWATLGIDPFEEMHAGNSLVDRNGELLVNIL